MPILKKNFGNREKMAFSEKSKKKRGERGVKMSKIMVWTRVF